jgi:putative endonuclease
MFAAKDPAGLGRWGEAIARSFLERCGYRCLATRYRCPGGEIDIVMEGGDLLLFVEVKTRGRNMAGSPEEAVATAQLQRLRRAARYYLWRHPPVTDRYLRFDVVAIEFGGEAQGCSLRHHPGVC